MEGLSFTIKVTPVISLQVNDVITEFLQKGYAVIAFSMPLLGLNDHLITNHKRFGRLEITNHERMKLLTLSDSHPLKYFVEPVIRIINYLEQRNDQLPLAMVGIGEGGWITHLAAAVDSRIILSFPVAIALYFRMEKKDWGGWEQVVPEFLQIANYLELFVLGSAGTGRAQVQVLNLFDPCCFSGGKASTYSLIISSIVETIGPGRFQLYFDDSHREHKISSNVVNLIDEKIRETKD